MGISIETDNRQVWFDIPAQVTIDGQKPHVDAEYIIHLNRLENLNNLFSMLHEVGHIKNSPLSWEQVLIAMTTVNLWSEIYQTDQERCFTLLKQRDDKYILQLFDYMLTYLKAESMASEFAISVFKSLELSKESLGQFEARADNSFSSHLVYSLPLLVAVALELKRRKSFRPNFHFLTEFEEYKGYSVFQEKYNRIAAILKAMDKSANTLNWNVDTFYRWYAASIIFLGLRDFIAGKQS